MKLYGSSADYAAEKAARAQEEAEKQARIAADVATLQARRDARVTEFDALIRGDLESVDCLLASVADQMRIPLAADLGDMNANDLTDKARLTVRRASLDDLAAYQDGAVLRFSAALIALAEEQSVQSGYGLFNRTSRRARQEFARFAADYVGPTLESSDIECIGKVMGYAGRNETVDTKLTVLRPAARTVAGVDRA